MSRTGYSADDRNHTEKAHLCAKISLYPAFFGCDADQIEYQEGIEYIDDSGKNRLAPLDWCDKWLSIDRVLRVPAPTRLGYLEFTVQERFERAQAASHRNISITEFNVATKNPSELYKIKTHYFVSGYYDASTNRLVGKAHVCNTERILKAVADGGLKYYTKPNDKSQTFITLGYDDLRRVGAVLMAIDFRADPPLIERMDDRVLSAVDELLLSYRELSRGQAVLMGMMRDLIDLQPAKKKPVASLVATKTKDLFGQDDKAA